jgi:hypothetical protein
VAQLADPDPVVRDSARETLLALRRSELLTLREAVATGPQLTPDQVRVLRDCVAHVFLSGEPYEVLDKSGFVGINLTTIPLRPNAGRGEGANAPNLQIPGGQGPGGNQIGNQPPGDPADNDSRTIGILVTDPWPGFASYRYLQEGDVITGIDDQTQFANTDNFSNTINTRHTAGSVVRLHVIRRGKATDISVILSARPPCASGGQIAPAESPNTFRARRDAAARDYWEREFAPAIPGLTEQP